MHHYFITLRNGGCPLCTIERLKPTCDTLVSSVAINFNSRRYIKVLVIRLPSMEVVHPEVLNWRTGKWGDGPGAAGMGSPGAGASGSREDGGAGVTGGGGPRRFNNPSLPYSVPPEVTNDVGDGARVGAGAGAGTGAGAGAGGSGGGSGRGAGARGGAGVAAGAGGSGGHGGGSSPAVDMMGAVAAQGYKLPPTPAGRYRHTAFEARLPPGRGSRSSTSQLTVSPFGVVRWVV
jgi:hypothetical protein